MIFKIVLFTFSALCLTMAHITVARAQTFSAPADLPYLSLESALLFSLHESTKIKIADEKSQQALFSKDEAKSEYYPDITFSAEGGIEFNDPAGFSEVPEDGDLSYTGAAGDIGLSIRQMVYDKSKFMEVARREELVSAKDYEGQIVVEDVIEATISAYIDVLVAQKTAYLSAELLVLMNDILEKVKFSFDEGGISKAKFGFAAARLALAESKYNASTARYADSVARLEALIGPMPEFLVVEPETLTIRDYDLSVYKHLASRKNTEIQLANANIKAGELDYERQKASYLPTVDFVFDAGQTYNDGGDVGLVKDASAKFRLQYDIFKGFERRASKNRIASRVRELEYEKEDLIKEITKNVKVGYSEVLGIEDTIDARRKEVDAYFSLRDIAQAAVAEGEVDLFQEIENEEDIYDALSQVFELQSDKYKTSYELLKLIGSLKKNKFCESC